MKSPSGYKGSIWVIFINEWWWVRLRWWLPSSTHIDKCEHLLSNQGFWWSCAQTAFHEDRGGGVESWDWTSSRDMGSRISLGRGEVSRP